ncbi:hypothetical protein [Nonomuraea sp. NPDC050643]|uniref:hypothetical protein n=1 Tax=Nonomuraea sp. NPDC050643 TaxID=3155660 RepID=UPI0033F2470C
MNRRLAWAARMAARLAGRRRRPVRRPAGPLVLLRVWRPVSVTVTRHTSSTVNLVNLVNLVGRAGRAGPPRTASTLVVARTVLLTGPSRTTVARLGGGSRDLRRVERTVSRSRTRTTATLTSRRTVRERHTGFTLIRRDGTRSAALPHHRHIRVEHPAREWRGPGGEPVTGPPVPAGPVVTRVPPRPPVPGPEPRTAADPGPPPLPPPALDLDRITDDVVRRIDRRIVAHRERLGRI